MPLSMYQASVPVFLQLLGSLSKLLQQAAAHAETRKIDPAVLLSARLSPDMLPLTGQVQLVIDHAKGATAQLAGLEILHYPATEATFEELQARLAKTIDFLKSCKPEQLDGAEDRE